MIELIDALGRDKAVWVGHDWGSPLIWSVASHHPERCHGVANLCVPYISAGFSPDNLIPLVDRSIYPEAEFPAGQWDYMRYYEESFEAACAGFEGNIPGTVKLLFRAGSPAGAGMPAPTSRVRANGGWFPGMPGAPDLPLDTSVLTEEDFHKYAAALQGSGFFGPDSWYMNGQRNIDFAARSRNGGKLDMPVLFLHGVYDWVCQTAIGALADPMRRDCSNLTEVSVPSGHWMAQEQPVRVNAALTRWLAIEFPQLWPAAA